MSHIATKKTKEVLVWCHNILNAKEIWQCFDWMAQNFLPQHGGGKKLVLDIDMVLF